MGGTMKPQHISSPLRELWTIINPFQFYLTIWVKRVPHYQAPMLLIQTSSLSGVDCILIAPTCCPALSLLTLAPVPNMLHTVVTVGAFCCGSYVHSSSHIVLPWGLVKRVNTSHGRSIGLLPRHWNIKPFFLLRLLE